MKKTALIVAVAGMATALQAAPQESVTFTNVGSFSRFSEAGNVIQTHTFTGAYNVKRVNITGSLTAPVPATNSYAREACVQVTAPSGLKFIINPFTSLGYTGTIDVPAGAYSQLSADEPAAGTWTFEFFELFDDNRVAAVPPATATTPNSTDPDQTWTSITITLDDEAIAGPPAPIPVNPSVTWTNIPSTVGFNVAGAVAGTSWTQLTFEVPADQTQIVDTAVFSGQGTGTAMNAALAAANQVTQSPTAYMLIRVKPPWSVDRFTGRQVILPLGTASASSTGSTTFFPVGLSSLSTPSAAATNNPPYQGLPIAQTTGPAAGTWVVEVQQNFASATLGPVNTGFWHSLSMSLASATPPVLTEPGFTLLDGGTITKTGTFTGPGEKKWYKFTVPAGVSISQANGNALDIGMFGTALTPQNDACIGIYTPTGGLLATSFNTGPGALPQFTWGRGIRNPQGAPADADPGLPFDGSNPGAAPPNNARPALDAGDYYVLVNNGDDGVTFRAGLFNSDATTENNVGSYSVMFRSWLTNNTAPFEAPPATDLGTIEGPVMTQNAIIGANTRYKWYKFTLPEEVSDTTGKYIDIDTANTLAPLNDTNIAVYDNTGALKSSNDDIAAGWGAENPTGGNSALSFGSSNEGNGRDYTAINPNLPLAFGADGVLAAGDYYLQVSMCCATYNNDRFWVVNDYVTTVANGGITVALRSNFPELGSPCGPADVGMAGGEPGQDSLLDNNDFIAFINFFFDQDPIADQGVAGGEPGSDGLYDNNDFIAFINNFFAGCN